MNKSDKRAPSAKGAHRRGPAESDKGAGLDQWSLAAVRARAAKLGTPEVDAVEMPTNIAAPRSQATEGDAESPDRPGLSGDGSGLWWLPDALQDLANQMGLSQEGYRELVQEALVAASRTRSDRTRLILRSLTTQGEQHTLRSGLSAWVWPDELNAWLAAERRTYTWKPSLPGKDGSEGPAEESDAGNLVSVPEGAAAYEPASRRPGHPRTPVPDTANGGTGDAVCTALRHSTRGRRENLLTPVIKKAMDLAGPDATAAQVWAEMQRMASSPNPPAPLCGADKRGVRYQKDGKTASLSRDALRDRIRRARARDSAR